MEALLVIGVGVGGLRFRGQGVAVGPIECLGHGGIGGLLGREQVVGAKVEVQVLWIVGQDVGVDSAIDVRSFNLLQND